MKRLHALLPGLLLFSSATPVWCSDAHGITRPEAGPLLFTISAVVSNNTACTSPNGGIDITVNPPGAYTYSWSDGSGTEDLTGLPGGTYTVTVTDGAGLTQTAQYTVVNQPLKPSLSILINMPMCNLPNGLIDVSVTNGVPPYTFLWSTGSTNSQITGLTAGLYTVTVTGGNGCTTTYIDNLPQSFPVPAPNGFSIAPDACPAPGSVDLDYSLTNFPQNFLMFQWSNGATTEDISGLNAGVYSVTVTMGTCTYTGTYTVPNLHNPPAVTAAITTATCNLNNGMINATASGGVGPYTYAWSSGDTDKKALNLYPGTYTVTVTGANDCTVTAEYTVPNFDPPINVSGTVTANTECIGGNGAISLQVSPPDAYTFEWSDGETTQSIGGLPAADYIVTVTGNGTCTRTATFTVPDLSSFIQLSLSGIAPACGQSNGSIHLTASGGGGVYTFLWSNGADTQNLDHIPGGAYEVTVSDGTSCAAEGSFILPNRNLPVAQADISPPSGCTSSDGAIDLTPDEALPPYTFIWSNGATTEDLSGIPAGPYAVTITSSNGCKHDTSFLVVNGGASFTLADTVFPLTHCLAPNGGIDLSVSPAGTYFFHWSNGATTEDLTQAPAGAYTVAVSDGSCTLFATITIPDQRVFPLVSHVVTPEICGLLNGGIDLTVSGGVPPYGFTWSGGQSTEDLYGLAAGDYPVTVSDANGCSASALAQVPADTLFFSLSASTLANSFCTPFNGSIDLNVTPAGNYVYSWANGATTEDLAGISGGTYSVTVSAGGYCTANAVYSVADSVSLPVLASGITADTCGKSLGAIAISMAGGQTPFVFAWSGGAATQNLAGISGGVYTVTVTDAKGCTAVAALNVPDVPVAIGISGVATPNASCLTPDGSVTIQTVPPQPYSYGWSNGVSTQNLSGLVTGNYTVTVSTGATCTATATFSVPDQVESPVIAGMAAAANCADADGGIDLTVSGGTAPYVYSWSNGAATEDLSAVPAGLYTVTVTAGNGCTAHTAIAVPENVVPPLVTAIASANTFCAPNNGVLDLTVTAASGYQFSWSNGAVMEDLSGLAPGLYTVTVNSGGHCTTIAAFAVTDNTMAVSIAGQTQDVLCSGDASGAIDLSVSSGLAPFSYTWSTAGNQQDLSGLAAGDYSVTVTDQAMCSATAQFSIHQPVSGVQVACLAGAYVSAPGGTDGTAQLDIAGGTPPYAVAWPPGGGASNLPAGNFTIQNLGVGNYQVQVFDANNCSAQCSVTVELMPCQTAAGSMSPDLQTACGGGCLAAAYNPSGQLLEPGDVLQFVLQEGSGGQVVNEIARNTQPVFCFDPAKMQYGVTYYISAVAGDNDGSGNVDLSHFCSVVSPGAPVVFYENPQAVIAPPPPINCAVTTVALQGASSILGAQFQWNTLDGMISGSPAQALVTAGTAGTYTLVVESHGCRDTASVQVQDISNHPVATISAAPTDLLDCSIDEIILSGAAEGASGASAIWLANGMTLSIGATLDVSTPGVYQFIIVDTLTFCRDTANIIIGQNHAYPPLYIAPPQTLNCLNQTVTLNGSSAFPGINFSWALSSGTDTVTLGNGPDWTVSTPGTYLLTGTDPVNACTNTLAVAVQEDHIPPVAQAGGPLSIHCSGDTLTLDASGSTGAPNLVYHWTTVNGSIINGADTTNPDIVKPGTYALLVVNPQNGCQDTDQVLVNSLEPDVALHIRQPPCAGDNGAILIDSVSGATPPVLFSLDNGQTFTEQQAFEDLAPGPYSLLVEDAAGCSTTLQAQLNPGLPFLISLTPEATLTLGESYQINAQLSIPDSALQSVLWTPSSGLSCDTCLNPLATPPASMLYQVHAVSEKGCTASAALRLIVDRRIDLYVPNVFTPNGDGNNDVFLVFANTHSVRKVKSLQVYSRWGELLWENRDFMPNDPSAGWDGAFRGKPMNPGVFVWQLVAETADGGEVRRWGEVTVER